MSGEKFFWIGAPYWAVEFVMTLLYSQFGSGELSIFGVLVMIISMVVLPFLIGAKIAEQDGPVKFSILGALLVSAASIFAMALAYQGHGAGSAALFSYGLVIVTIFLIPQAAFGYVGAFLVKYAKAQSI